MRLVCLCDLVRSVDYFVALPNNINLATYRITHREWSVMQDFKFILSVSSETDLL